MGSFLTVFMRIVIYLLIAAGVASIFYHLRRKKLFGGYIGGFIVAIIGVVIGEFVIERLLMEKTIEILNFLVKTTGVNIITGFLGAYGAVYLMNKLNHDKERTRY